MLEEVGKLRLGGAELGEGLLQLPFCPALPVDVQHHGIKDGDTLPGMQRLDPQVHPQGGLRLRDQAKLMGERLSIPGGVQQGLQQLRPVPGIHQAGQVLAEPVQQFPVSPSGQGAQLLVAAETPDTAAAEFQHGGSRRNLIGRGQGGFSAFPDGIEKAGGHAVHGLIAGDAQRLAQQSGIGKGGAGAGKRHLL